MNPPCLHEAECHACHTIRIERDLYKSFYEIVKASADAKFPKAATQ